MKYQNTIEWMIRMLVISATLEFLVFNYRFWTDMNYDRIEVPLSIGNYIGEIAGTEKGTVLLQDPNEKNIVQFDLQGLEGVPVYNIALEAKCIDGKEFWNNYNGENYAVLSSSMVEVTMVLTADGKDFVLPARQLGAYGEGEYVIAVPKNRKPQMLTIQITGLKGTTVELQRVFLNVPRKMAFRWIRFLAVYGLLMFFYAMRPQGKLWEKQILDDEGKVSRGVFLAGGFFFAGVAALILALLLKNNVYIQGEGGFAPYKDLAHALAMGQTWIQELPGKELLAMEDPYDPVARLMKGIPYKLDYALYQGRYYVYFGIVPCLLFYLPVYLLAGVDVPSWIVLFFLIIAILVEMVGIVTAFAKRCHRTMTAAEDILVWLAGVAVLTLTAVISDPCAYYVPMLSGGLFYLAGILLYLRALENTEAGKKEKYAIIMGSFCMALTAGCRPQMVFAGVAAVPVLSKLLLKKEGDKTTLLWKNIISFVVPYVPVAAGLMIYNYIRFGSPFDFGAAYNLTFAYSYRLKFHIEAVGAGILYYLFRLPRFQLCAPYLEMTQLDWSNPGLLANHISTGGIYMLYPILFLSCYLWKKQCKMEEKPENGMVWMGRIWLFLVVAMAALSGVMGGLMDRYRMDFSVFAALALCLSLLRLFCETAPLIKGKTLQIGKYKSMISLEKLFRIVCICIVLWTVIISWLGYFEEGVWWLNTSNPEWYTMLAEQIEFWR